MAAYYNEIEPYAAQWLRNLIAAGLIAPGDVDERSILDVHPDDLRGYTQCHFFAGIGVWSHALRRAGWGDDRPVWTGSCPCQPFSSAGKGAGFTDERHLWPAWFHLVTEAKPGSIPIFGEQVASADGLAWLDLVSADLEGAGYAVAPVDLCAAGVGAPHIRQRLWFVAERVANAKGLRREGVGRPPAWEGKRRADECGSAGGLADSNRQRQPGRAKHDRQALESEQPASCGNDAGRRGVDSRPGAVNGFWSDADWISCRDGRWRPVESGTFPLADGVAGRVGQLRAYGNAINAEVATAVIGAYMDLRP